MELYIQDLLQRIATEARVLPQARAIVQAEIEKYEGMRLVLNNTIKNPEFTLKVLTGIDEYLESLKLVAQKFRHPHLALIRVNEHDNSEINEAVLQILKKINHRN